MIRHMRHGSPPRLTALQSILSPNRRESLPTPSAGVRITPNLPSDKKAYHLQTGAGHYGVFNGSRFRGEIAPRIAAFMARNAREAPQDRQVARNNLTALDPALLRIPHGRADAS